MSIENKTGVVVFLDALGVSNYERIDQFRHFTEELEILKSESEYVWNKWKKDFEKDGVILLDPELAFFQDSLIICFPEPEKDVDSTLHNFFAAQNWVMQFIVQAIGRHIYFRGAMAHGKFIFSESERSIAVLGKPVIDAYKFEKSGNWVGVIQTPDFQKKYLEVLARHAKSCNEPVEETIRSYNRFFVRYDVPLKEEEKEEDRTFSCFVVNWPTLVKTTEQKDAILIALASGMEQVDSHNLLKYVHTVNFFKYCENHQFFLE
ncbi:MAG: hypothetical protein LUQ31_04345 [Methanoregula sp.]|nr:hypothetical protein [Methanoregula sp.]